MMAPVIAPYGSWRSPIGAALVAAHTVRLGEIAVDGDSIYWSEGRPAEGGRNVIVAWSAAGGRRDLLEPPYDARSRVHEYGGGAFTVAGSTLVFSNFADQRLYRQQEDGAPTPLTAADAGRFADVVVDRRRQRLIGVREQEAREREPRNTLTSIALDDGAVRELSAGADFYSSPCLSPDGRKLAWLEWRHPDMPWDGTELWLAELDGGGGLRDARRIAGGREESIFAPRFSPDGVLHFVSDRTGWWNLYRQLDGGARPLAPIAAELGRPQWVFGLSTYDFLADGRVLCAFCRQGRWALGEVDAARGELREIATPFSHIDQLRATGERAVLIAAAEDRLPAVVTVDPASGAVEVLDSSSATSIDHGYLSVSHAIEFPTAGGRTAHAFFYPPRNDDFTAPSDERPILLVKSHGGPTAASSTAMAWSTQFWTSRGFALVDVNYGGSSGYGRAYRERLRGQWGVVDVDDCCAAARFLVEAGEVDGARLAIRGSSAGGYTTLAALAFRDLFHAGASYYGVGDLEALVRDTHKFESRYLDGLIGPYPQARERYRERSPLHHPDALSCPVIFFQGLEDRVVAPAQAEAMVKSLRRRGVPVAYLPFAGEQHGFRRAENISRGLEAELYFYSRVFGFTVADEIAPVEIENL